MTAAAPYRIWKEASEREALILDHMGQVRAIARRFQERLPGNVSLDDLVSTGVLGLIAAIDNYDPSQGTKLSTYAEYRIRGAIIDSLRNEDPMSRSSRKRSKEIESAIDALEQRLQRCPKEEEIAAELGLTLDEYHKTLSSVRSISISSVDSGDRDQVGMPLLAYIAEPEAKLPSTLTEQAEMESILAAAIARMPEIERTVLGLYYQNELSPQEIAAIVKLKPGRVSQIRCQAIARLRARLQRQFRLQETE